MGFYEGFCEIEGEVDGFRDVTGCNSLGFGWFGVKCLIFIGSVVGFGVSSMVSVWRLLFGLFIIDSRSEIAGFWGCLFLLNCAS